MLLAEKKKWLEGIPIELLFIDYRTLLNVKHIYAAEDRLKVHSLNIPDIIYIANNDLDTEPKKNFILKSKLQFLRQTGFFKFSMFLMTC